MIAHLHDLRDEVEDQEMVDRFAADWRSAGLDGSTMALLDFAVKLTEEPTSIDTDQIDSLRRQGFDDVGISSCVQVVSYFNYINRVADGLGVSLEDWISENGREKLV